MQSTPESGHRADFYGHKRKKGTKAYLAVDTLGKLLALIVTSANKQDRAQVEPLAHAVQDATGGHVGLVFVDEGYTGDTLAHTAAAQGITLPVVNLPESKHGFVLSSRRWSQSVRSPDKRASGSWPVTTSDCRKPSPDSISSPLGV